MARTLPTKGLAPIDGYLVDSAGRNVGHFTRYIVGTVATYGATVKAEVDVAATGILTTHATALRGIVSGASGATTNVIAPLSLETYITDAPTALHVMIRFNTDATKDTPDALFTGSKHSVAYSNTATGTAVAGGIRVKVLGANLTNTFGYIRVYQDE